MNLNYIDGMADDCYPGGIWSIMSHARDNAVRAFIADTNSKLLELNRLKRQPFYGTIGRRTYKQNRSPNQTYAGVRWYCADIVGGVAVIKKIYTLFSQTGTITLYVYNKFNELLGTYTLNTTANILTENDISDLELDFHVDFESNPEYFFVFQVGANVPKDNQSDSSCCGKGVRFDTRKPYFWSQSNKTVGWADYIMCGSCEVDTLDFMDLGFTTTNYMNGLLFEVEFKCKIGETICKDELDYTANPLAASIAFAVRYKAGETLLTDFLASDKLTRYAMINGEEALANIEMYQTKYKDLLDYIVKEVDIKATDCFECDDILKLKKTGIFATY